MYYTIFSLNTGQIVSIKRAGNHYTSYFLNNELGMMPSEDQNSGDNIRTQYILQHLDSNGDQIYIQDNQLFEPDIYLYEPDVQLFEPDVHVYDAPKQLFESETVSLDSNGDPEYDSNGDLIMIPGDPILDSNGDFVYAPLKESIDANGNFIYTQGPPLLDENGDLIYKKGPPLLDSNGDHVFQLGDPILDSNGDPTYEQVPYRTVENRPVSSITINKTSIIANDTDQAVISNIPNPSDVKITDDGETSVMEVTDGTLNIKSTTGTTIDIFIESTFPEQDFITQVIAT